MISGSYDENGAPMSVKLVKLVDIIRFRHNQIVPNVAWNYDIIVGKD